VLKAQSRPVKSGVAGSGWLLPFPTIHHQQLPAMECVIPGGVQLPHLFVLPQMPSTILLRFLCAKKKSRRFGQTLERVPAF